MVRIRGEGVVKHWDYYSSDLGDGIQIHSLLFDQSCPVRLDRDLAYQLSLALDRTNDFEDSSLPDYAGFGGRVRFAPGLVWAHTACQQGHHVAVLPLPLNEVPAGRVAVTVGNATLDVFFVIGESQHVAFFRALISLENADETAFERLASSAFPALGWADDVWRGLRDFSRPYVGVRDELVRCLGGLNDYGAMSFDQFAADPQRLTRELSAQIGVSTSDENGSTKRHTRSRRDRTRRHHGVDKVFWWHVKLQPHVDRIHFRWERPSAGIAGPTEGCIVVGLFKDHCVLPG